MTTNKTCAACGAAFTPARPTSALYCSERCRKRAHRAKGSPSSSSGPPLAAGDVVDGIEEALTALEEEGRLSKVDAGKVAILRSLAAQVVAAPGNSALWRELRAAEQAVMEAAAAGEEFDAFAAMMAALRDPDEAVQPVERA